MMCIEDPPAPMVEPPSSAPNPLQAIKPYNHHKGDCGGLVIIQMGQDAEDGTNLMVCHCLKCGKDDIVELTGAPEDVHTLVPPWVEKPNV